MSNILKKKDNTFFIFRENSLNISRPAIVDLTYNELISLNKDIFVHMIAGNEGTLKIMVDGKYIISYN